MGKPTIIMPGTEEAKSTEEFLKKVPEGAVPNVVPLIGAKGEKGPPPPKYVKGIQLRKDGKMECVMRSGKIYCISDLIKANAMFHHNEGVMLDRIKALQRRMKKLQKEIADGA